VRVADYQANRAASCCPDTYAECQAWHRRVKADAASGAPTTEHGRNLLATARPWPELECSLGECLCGSSLCFNVAGATGEER